MEIDKEQYLKKFEVDKHRISEQYQEICDEAETWFGKAQNRLIWSLPWRKGITDNKLRNALEVCKTKQIKDIRYLLGVLKN